jgi:hypothetical protein
MPTSQKPASPVKALIFHQGDEPIAKMIESLGSDTSHEKFRARKTPWIPFRVDGGRNGGNSATFSVYKGTNLDPVWEGRIIAVASDVKKREALAAFGLSREETLYLALAKRHQAWLDIVYGEHMTRKLTDVFFPPASIGLRLNDFPFIFLVNDKTYVFGNAHTPFYYYQIGNALNVALAGSRVWQQPRSAEARVEAGVNV